MKTIFLVRHAKSFPANQWLLDIDRPLSEKGILNANAVSKHLQNLITAPDLVISSQAARTMSTALIFVRNLKYPVSKIKIDETLYESTFGDYMKCLLNKDDRCNSLMLFGHNNTITETGNFLSNKFIDDMPTSSVVCLEFDIKSWNQINDQKGELKFFIAPQSLS